MSQPQIPSQSASIRTVPVADIEPFRDRERDPEKFRCLTESIRQHGLLEPVVVAPNDPSARKKWRLVAGHGRLRALKKLGIQKVDAMVREDFELRDYIVENWRRDLSAYDGAVLMEYELSKGQSPEAVAAMFCVTLPVVKANAQTIRALHPELHRMARSRKINMQDAKRIIKKLPEQKAQEALVASIRSAEKATPSESVVKRAIDDVVGAIKVRGSVDGFDSIEKLEKVKREVAEQMEGTKEALSVIRSHWLKSVGEIRVLCKDPTYRKLFGQYGIDFKPLLD
jgi:ParB/RepB/Spo0J family partition protein